MIDAYFSTAFPNYAPLRQLPEWELDCVCGEECVRAIDAAVTFADLCTDADDGDYHHIADICHMQCRVICYG